MGIEHTCTYPPPHTHNVKINFFEERGRERKGNERKTAWWYLVFVLVKSVSLFCEVFRPEINMTESRVGIRFGDPSVPLEPAVIVWMSHPSQGVHV